MPFDKEKFANLLRKAMGNRSINQYWLNSEVSATYISRLLRKLVDNPPGPEIIRKLADTAQNEVTYQDLMEAAGHFYDISPKELRIKYAHLWPQIRKALLDHIDKNQRQRLIETIAAQGNFSHKDAEKFINEFLNSFEDLPLDGQLKLLEVIAPIVTLNTVPTDIPDAKPLGKRIKVPVIGTVCAGNGSFAFEEDLGHEYTDIEDIGPCNNYFWLRVKGDSMVGEGIMENDLALVCQKPDVESGSLAVVIVDREEGQIKRVIKRDNTIVLQSANPTYPTALFVGEEASRVRIVGEVIETKRTYKKFTS